MAKKKQYYMLFKNINQGDIYSSQKAGLESDNVFASVSEEPLDAIDSIDEEVEDQLDTDDIDAETAVFSEDDVPEEETYGPDVEEWENAQKEQEDYDNKKPEDCINIMEVVSQYTNNYRKIFVEIANDKILDGTGDFKNYKFFADVEKVFEDLSGMHRDTKNAFFDNLAAAREILLDTNKMTSICGDKRAPFFYEGFQLAYLAQLHNLYLAVPYTLKLKSDYYNVLETMGIDKDIKFFDRVLKDVITAKDVLGTKIVYQKSEKSELTGKSDAINETVYSDSDLISEGHDEMISDFEYAGESIQNLIDIKANKALLEYNVLIRDFSLVVTYLKDYQPGEHWEDIRKLVVKLLNEENTDKIAELLVATCSELDKVLVTMSKAYKNIVKESAEY